MNVIKKLENYIKDSGIKQKKIAETLDVSPQHLSSVINGKYKLSLRLEEQIKQLVK